MVRPLSNGDREKMARGQQKLQSQQKNQKKQQEMKKGQGANQKAAAQKALIYSCAVCKVSLDLIFGSKSKQEA